MTGIAFFESAKNALEIMSNNSSIVMQVVGLGDLIIGMARFMITMIVTVGFYRFITAFPFLLFGGTVVDAYNPTIALAVHPNTIIVHHVHYCLTLRWNLWCFH